MGHAGGPEPKGLNQIRIILLSHKDGKCVLNTAFTKNSCLKRFGESKL